jgi:hypothetical protein
MIHVIFNEADASVLQEAIALDESMKGEIIIIRDDYSIGPIVDIYSDAGRAERLNWWKEVQPGALTTAIFEEETDDYLKMQKLADRLREHTEEKVWIWAAQNKQDVCGYYWLLYFMKEFQSRVFILYLNNLPFINDKGNIFYPVKLSEIPAKEFLKAKKLAREITLSEFEVDPDEWVKLCSEAKSVRILEGGKKIVQFDEDYFDGELRRFVMPDWQKVTRIIHNFQNKAKNSTVEGYLLWRLLKMAESGKFEMQGSVEKLKDFELKNKAAEPAVNA